MIVPEYFVNSHPGGKQILLDNANEDITDVFDGIHSDDAMADLKSFTVPDPMWKQLLPYVGAVSAVVAAYAMFTRSRK